jgi:solute carrier family 25 phosphate transporter 23/24/25/41
MPKTKRLVSPRFSLCIPRSSSTVNQELWHIFHNELDLDSNGHLDAEELTVALQKAGGCAPSSPPLVISEPDVLAGLQVSPSMLSDFMTSLTASPHSHSISFQEFRDFLLLLPRRVSTKEIYRFYEVRKFLGDDGRGPARVTMEGAFRPTAHGCLR